MPNERSTGCVNVRLRIKCMPHRFTLKCWVRYVIKIFTMVARKVIKRLILAPSFTNCITDIPTPCKTCHVLHILCQVSKQLSTRYHPVWRGLQNPSNESGDNCHPTIKTLSHAMAQTSSGILPAAFKTLVLHGQWE